MTIKSICEEINRIAFREKHPFSNLQIIRQQLKDLKTIREKVLFNPAHAKPNYAFHFGGRKETQFNFGKETWTNGKSKIYFRYGIAFSIERSQFFHDPENYFKPRIKVFNDFLRNNKNYFSNYSMYIHKGTKNPNPIKKVSEIEEKDTNSNTFIFIGKFLEKDTTQITMKDIEDMVITFDRLLPLYEHIEKNAR